MVASQTYEQLGHHRQLLKKRESLVYTVQILIDLTLTVGLLTLLVYIEISSWGLHDYTMPENYRILLIVTVLIQFIIYTIYGVYRRSGSLYQGFHHLSIAWILLLSTLALIGFLVKVSESFSREVFLFWAILGYLLQLVTYIFMYHAMGILRKHFVERAECVVVGTDRLAQHLVSSVNGNKWLPDKIIGYITYDDCSSDEDDRRNHNKKDVPVLGDMKNITAVIRQYEIKRVYIALPLRQSDSVEKLHIELLGHSVDLIWVPDIYALKLLNHSVREVAGLPLIFLNESPMTSTRTGIFWKMVLDRVIAVGLLIFFLPLFVIVALVIKITSKGPIFFKQNRHGFDGSIFKIWKFRSMYLHPQSSGELRQAERHDGRVTPVGRFIRRTSIDELPQLFNVLLGNMSLVGPRPHAVQHNNFYDDHIEAYLLRHRIKPGITGLAQINGCRGETKHIEKMRKRVDYDVQYINNWSLWLDIKILAKTPFSLFSDNIY